eukprot:scaffold5837_cov76-Cyclotella_meneghiniana.AAC.8
MNITPRFTNSSIYLLGLLTWAVVMIQAFATSPSSPSHNTFARNNQWGVSRGGSSSVALSKQRPSSSLKSLAEDSNEVKASKEIPHIRPYNGVSVNSKEQQSKLYVKADIPKGEIAETSAKKTIVTPGGFADTLLPATYVAETNLPTDIGHFRIRAYRINGIDAAHPLGAGAGLGRMAREPRVFLLGFMINALRARSLGVKGVYNIHFILHMRRQRGYN